MPSAWNQYLLAATESPCLPAPHPSTSTHRTSSCSARSPWEISRPILLTYYPEPIRWSMTPLKCSFLPFAPSQAAGSLILDIPGLPGDPALVSLSCPCSYHVGSHHIMIQLRIEVTRKDQGRHWLAVSCGFSQRKQGNLHYGSLQPGG